ncbi:MAG: histidine phosphatase family protein [archaeon]|nr:histidine phosphatase family protein [archaeon]
MSCKTIFIVRHGETDWNNLGRKQGHVQTHLNETGRKHAEMLASYFAKENISAIYSSDLFRAVETAEIIAKSHNLKVLQDSFLREIDLGTCEGLTKDEMRLRFPEFFSERKKNYFNTPYPNGESRADVRDRVKKFFGKISDKEGIILIVGHTGFNRNLISFLTGFDGTEISNSEFGHNIIAKFDCETKSIEFEKI